MEPGAKGFGRLDQDILVSLLVNQVGSVLKCAAEAGMHHESDIMMGSQELDFLQVVCLAFCIVGKSLVTGEGIHFPKGTGEETGCPARLSDEFDLPILEGVRDLDLGSVVRSCGKSLYLYVGDTDMVFDYLLYGRATGSDREGKHDRAKVVEFHGVGWLFVLTNILIFLLYS